MPKLLKSFVKVSAAIAVILAGSYSAMARPTVNVLVVQQDTEPGSMRRSNAIQEAVRNAWNSELQSPAGMQMLRDRYRIEGMDVYDENAVSQDFYNDNRQRRDDRELIALSRLITNPPIDVLVLYMLKARAVADPYTRVTKLILSMRYRALDVKSGRVLGGDSVDLDPNGVPMTGCATRIGQVGPDRLCVERFISREGERLARDAANSTALRIAGLLGRAYGRTSAKGGVAGASLRPAGAPGEDDDANETNKAIRSGSAGMCPSIPSTFEVSYEGYTPKQLSFIETAMVNWACYLNLNTSKASLTRSVYSYKTRLNKGVLLRNIRSLNDQMGVDAEPRTSGRNRISVRAVAIRSN